MRSVRLALPIARALGRQQTVPRRGQWALQQVLSQQAPTALVGLQATQRRMCAAQAKKEEPAKEEPAKAAEASSGAPKEEVERPTPLQLRRLFTNSMVPFVAFGIVDQTVLIYAGDAIDNTVGVYMGLPTLAAAAMGQIFSDTAGVLTGGYIEACALKLGLPLPNFTEGQLRLGLVKGVQTAGGVVGVICGCIIGMCNLLFLDLTASERAKKAKEMEVLMKTIMADGRQILHCERATLWVVDHEKKELWSSVALGVENILRVPMDGGSIAGWVANHKEMANIPDVTKDPRWAGNNKDAKQAKVGDFVPKSMLVAPVCNEDGKVVAVIQLLNKMDNDGTNDGFTNDDERMVKMMAAHVGVFMEQLG